jgi:archaellum component FlaC
MTTEQRLRKLEDALTVEAQLLDRHERLDEERHVRIDARFKALARIVEGLAGKINMLGDRQLTTQAALDRLIEQMDRFLRGQPGNGGRKQD